MTTDFMNRAYCTLSYYEEFLEIIRRSLPNVPMHLVSQNNQSIISSFGFVIRNLCMYSDVFMTLPVASVNNQDGL